jgi:hypothetical protein
MKHETSVALYQYWQSCRRKECVPISGIRAGELAPLLPSLFLIDLARARQPIFRFCGASVAARYGRDLTDDNFLALWSKEDQKTLDADLRSIRVHSTGLIAGVLAETVGGFTTFEMLLLPLAGESGRAGAIGSMARIGGHEEVNRIRARIVAQGLRSVRFLPREESPQKAVPAAAFEVLPSVHAGPRRYGHLTVLSGGK